jgi:drug/metabolite transporter (DMT)-like permease
MFRLFTVTIIWAFSFSLIGHFLAGSVDPYISILLRFLIASFVLLPFFDFSLLRKKISLHYIFIGMVQIGLMYIFYYKSFEFLSVPLVALLTITTPLYVQLISDLFFVKFSKQSLFALGASLIGAIFLKWAPLNQLEVRGIILIQLANICFATGQVLYKFFQINKRKEIPPLQSFFLFYVGAIIPIIPLVILKSDMSKLPHTMTHFVVILWLGVMASAVGYYLWNSGSLKVHQTQLAVMNNAVIPCAILVNFVIWKKLIQWQTFLIGTTLIALSILISHKIQRQYQSLKMKGKDHL